MATLLQLREDISFNQNLSVLLDVMRSIAAQQYQVLELTQGLGIGEQPVPDLIAEHPIGFEPGLGEELLGGGLVGKAGIFSAECAPILVLVASVPGYGFTPGLPWRTGRYVQILIVR